MKELKADILAEQSAKDYLHEKKQVCWKDFDLSPFDNARRTLIIFFFGGKAQCVEELAKIDDDIKRLKSDAASAQDDISTIENEIATKELEQNTNNDLIL